MSPIDKYRDYAHLAQHEHRGVDFEFLEINRASEMVVLAPHGGGIEPGTSELAAAIAGKDYSLFLFEGLKATHNFADLHISSHRFDAPGCRPLIQSARTALAIHGEGSLQPVVYLGGSDRLQMTLLQNTLQATGFIVRKHDNPELQGEHPDNICNIGTSHAGVQLEISHGLRAQFFASLDRAGRKQPTPLFHDFVSAVRFCCPSIMPKTTSEDS